MWNLRSGGGVAELTAWLQAGAAESKAAGKVSVPCFFLIWACLAAALALAACILMDQWWWERTDGAQIGSVR